LTGDLDLKQQRLLTTSLHLLSGSALGRGFSFLLNLLLSRALGPSGLGAFNIFLTTIQTFEVTSQGGLDYGLSCKLVDTEPKSEDYLKSQSLQALKILNAFIFITSIPFAIWLFINRDIFEAISSALIFLGFGAIIITCVSESFASLRWQVLLLWGQTKLYALRQGVLVPIKLTAAYLGAVIGGLAGSISGYALITAMQNLWLTKKLAFLNTPKSNPDDLSANTNNLSLIKEGFPLYITNTISALVFLPLLGTVALDAGLDDVGYLRIGQLIVQAFTIIPSAILPNLFIKLRQTSDTDLLGQTEPTLRLIWCGGLVILLAYLTVDQKLIALLFGENFIQSIQPTRILILCSVLDSVNQILHSPLLAKRQILFFTVTQNGAALLAALTGFFLIPLTGLSGYLIAKLIFSWTPVMIYCLSFYTKLSSKLLFPSLLCSSASMTYLCWSLSTNYLTTICISVVTGLALLCGLYPLRKILV
jgi:O-antigen/teichoic acid export membrane protein